MKEEVKARLLGRALTSRPVDGNHTVSMQRITAPFREMDSVTRVFCTGCGAIMEFDKENAAEITETAGFTVASFAGVFLECSR